MAVMQATYEPMDAYREIPVVFEEAALLFIDVQNYNCHPDGALYGGNPDVSSVPAKQCFLSDSQQQCRRFSCGRGRQRRTSTSGKSWGTQSQS